MEPFFALLRRELFERVRQTGHFIMRTSYVFVLFFIIVVVAWDSILSSFEQPMSRAPDMGEMLFNTFSFVQFGLVVLLVPLIGAGAIVEERLGRSLRLLLLTHLTVGQIAAGKFMARLALVALIVVSNLPILFFSAILGGVEPMDVVHVFALTMATVSMLLGVSLVASAVVDAPVKAALVTYAWFFALMMSLFGLEWIDQSWFVYWHAPLTLGIAVVEPLNLGASWWIAGGVNLAFGVGCVAVASGLLRRGVRKATIRSTVDKGGAVVPAKVWDNPMIWREVVRKGRPARWIAICAILGVGSALIVVGSDNSASPNEAYIIGLNLVTFLACVFCLAVGANAFAQEKREQTLELIRLTFMSPMATLMGKMSAVWRIVGYFAIWMLPTLLIIGFLDDEIPILGGPLPMIAVTLVLTFFGSVGIFYSLVASTPMRAAFPAVATFVYVATPMSFWPMIMFQHEDALSITVIIGWALIFVPPLILIARTSPWKVAWSVGYLALLAVVVLMGGLFAEEGFLLIGVNPFVFVNMSVFIFTDALQSDFIGAFLVGALLMSGSSFFFLYAASALLEAPLDGESAESEDPVLAAALSAIVPGAGQIYLGHTGRGGIIMVVSFLMLCGIGLCNVAAAIDAYSLAMGKREKRHLHAERRRTAFMTHASEAAPEPEPPTPTETT